MAMANPVSTPVADLDPDTRATFLGRVYQHLALAVAAFIVFESLLFFTGAAEALYDFVSGSATWLLILGAFMVVNWMATRMAIAGSRIRNRAIRKPLNSSPPVPVYSNGSSLSRTDDHNRRRTSLLPQNR